MQTQPIETTRRTAPRRTVNLPPPPAAEKPEEKEPESQLAAGLSSLTLPPPPAAPAAAAGGMSLPPPPAAPVNIPRGPGRPAAARSLTNFKSVHLEPGKLAEILGKFPILSRLSVNNIPVAWTEEQLSGLRAVFGQNFENANPAILAAINAPFKFTLASLTELAADGKGAEVEISNFQKYMEALTAAVLNELKAGDTELGAAFREKLENAAKVQTTLATLPPPPSNSGNGAATDAPAVPDGAM